MKDMNNPLWSIDVVSETVTLGSGNSALKGLNAKVTLNSSATIFMMNDPILSEPHFFWER